MRKLAIVLMLILTGCASTGGSGYRPYEFYYFDKEPGDKLVASTYYEVLAVYYYTVRKLHISYRLPSEDTEHIIYTMINALEQGKAIQLQIPHYNSGRTLRVTVRTDYELKNKKPNLLILSNYDIKKQKPMPDSKLDSTYANLFYMVGDKLVNFAYIDEPTTKEQLAKMDTVQLSNEYLYDEKFDNDEKGFKMLKKAIPAEKNALNKLYMQITLAEYHMMFNDYDAAKATLQEAEKTIEAETDKDTQDRMRYNWRITKNIYTFCTHYDQRRKAE